jgi:hypothetical protein
MLCMIVDLHKHLPWEMHVLNGHVEHLAKLLRQRELLEERGERVSEEHLADEQQTRIYLLAQLGHVRWYMQDLFQWLPGEPEPGPPPEPPDGDYTFSARRISPL